MITLIRQHLLENNVPLWAHCIMIRHLYEHRNNLEIAERIRIYNNRKHMLFHVSHDRYTNNLLKLYTKYFKRSYKLLYYNNPYFLPDRSIDVPHIYRKMYRNLKIICKYFKTDLFYISVTHDNEFINNFICGDRLYDLHYYIQD